MRTEIRNLTIEECLSSLGGAGGERKVYYKLINGKLYPFYYQAKLIINLCTIDVTNDITKKAIIGEKSIGISIYLNKTSLIGPTSGSVNILNIS